MSWIGLDSVKVMNSLTSLTVEDKNDPENILTAVGNHFMPQEEFIVWKNQVWIYQSNWAREYRPVRCEICASCRILWIWSLCESLICDRLVVDTRYSATRDRLLREHPVPGLTRCIEVLRVSELSTKHKEQLKDETRKTSYMQLTNRVLEIESKVDVIEDMNQSKVNKKKQNAKQFQFSATN